MDRERQLTTAFNAVALALTDDLDLPDLLQSLADRAAVLVRATAVGVFLDDQRGGLQLCSSSSHATGPQQVFQSAAREGPCLEAFRSGEPAVAQSGPDRARTPRAGAAGSDHTTTHAVPLRARRQVVGSLGLFFADQVGLDAGDLAVVEALAGMAGLGFLQEQGGHQELIAAHLQAALRVRVLVEQAKGVIAETLDIPIEDAFHLLRARALQDAAPIAETAALVLKDRLAPRHLQRD